MLYDFELEETNGEREYTYFHLIEADDLDKANRIAEHHASTFFGDPNVELEGNAWFSCGGQFAVTITRLGATTKEEWLQKMYNRALITA